MLKGPLLLGPLKELTLFVFSEQGLAGGNRHFNVIDR